MTGFARAEHSCGDATCVWELRSVNGRGLDLRFRLPAGYEGLEPKLREAAGKVLTRGNITANLSVKHAGESHLVVDTAALDQAVTLAMDLHKRIPGSPVPRAEALLGLPGVIRAAQVDETVDADATIAAFARALASLVAARQAEGERLSRALSGMLDEISQLYREAAMQAADQPAAQRARFMENLSALLRDAPPVPEERIAQEIALLAARSDVREELDRLASHLEAARILLGDAVNIGRRFDFLVQEFVRETNTLSSKSATTALTTTCLGLKARIEQLREQVQNIE
jgi:uncharacterized protein (TIGR00255 family)